MDSSETPMDTQSSAATKQISGPTNVAPSVIVSLHPLVVLNIAEHWTRVRAQIGNKVQVYGALLGRQKGRNIELCTSFEIKMKNPNETSEFAEEIDLEFLNTQIAQFKQVFSDFDFLGWYSCGSEDMSVAGEEKSSSANKYDIHLHKQVSTINESALILKLDPFGKHTDLPVSIFESVIDFIDDEPHIVFIKLEYTLATDEAERIGVDHIAKHSTDSTSSASSNMIQSTVAEHLNAQYSAITLLYNRIKVICEYVKDVKSGRVKKNNDILREIQSLCHRLPIMNTPNFYKDFYTLFNDVTWIAYLGVIMQSSNTLNQYLNKFLIMHDKSITKRGRSILI